VIINTTFHSGTSNKGTITKFIYTNRERITIYQWTTMGRVPWMSTAKSMVPPMQTVAFKHFFS